nr:putative ribonuclease H-like domain-containing protein [Tanacetum cinerariifolium]
MTENYMPSGPDVELDYSKFTYGLKQTSVDESDSKPSEYASCESDSSVETTTSMPEADDPHRPLKDKGIIDSGCSRHMTGNKAHLADYQDFKGGSVAFGGSNGRITGKGKIKAGKLDFEDVYYVEELKHYNLFFVSQMCDKKLIHVLKIHTDDNVTDLLTKAFDVSRIFKCWSYHHTTNGHQFTMSNTYQELASPEANGFCKELASPKQTALGKDISNPFMAGSETRN